MPEIHPSALVDAAAEVADDVQIGPFAVVGAQVSIGSGCQIDAHAVIYGPTSIGRNNHIHSQAVIGGDPQDKKYAGGDSRLEIGNGNTIRECVTVNRGTADGGAVTRIGDDNWIMAYVHIAHDCQVGNHTVLANNATLAGHVVIEDHVILAGFSRIHQFCRIGQHAFVAMGSGTSRDVPPCVMVQGFSATPRGINREGLKRRGVDGDELVAIKRAYRTLYQSGLRLEEAIKTLEKENTGSDLVTRFTEFLKHSERSIVR